MTSSSWPKPMSAGPLRTCSAWRRTRSQERGASGGRQSQPGLAEEAEGEGSTGEAPNQEKLLTGGDPAQGLRFSHGAQTHLMESALGSSVGISLRPPPSQS